MKGLFRTWGEKLGITSKKKNGSCSYRVSPIALIIAVWVACL